MLAVASLTMLSSATQAAESADSLPQKVVSFKDLNLSSTEGVSVLFGRIKSAARDVCGHVDQRELASVAATKACIDQATRHGDLRGQSSVADRVYISPSPARRRSS